MTSSFRRAVALGIAAMAVSARAGTEITVASYPPFDASVKAALPLWEKLHPDVKVKLVSRGFGDHHKGMAKALESGADLPDVLAVELGYVHVFAESKGLADLGAPPFSARPLLSQVLAFTVPQASAGAEPLAAIPADVGPGTLLYRKDLLDRAGVTEADLTGSWDSFIEAGKKVKAATGASMLANAQAIKDVVIRTGLRDGEGIFFDAKGQPILDAPRFERAFALARKAREADIDARIEVWSKEWAEGLKRGTIATQPMGSWLAWHLGEWLAPQTRGLWRAAQLPGGAFAVWGGDFYAIPKEAAHAREAWEFIQFMCFDRGAQLAVFKATEAWPALKAAQDDPWIDQPMPFLGGQRARQVWKVSAASVPVIPPHRHDALADHLVSDTLKRVLEEDANARWALAEANERLGDALKDLSH